MKNKLIATVILLISFSSEALEKIKNYDVFIILFRIHTSLSKLKRGKLMIV